MLINEVPQHIDFYQSNKYHIAQLLSALYFISFFFRVYIIVDSSEMRE